MTAVYGPVSTEQELGALPVVTGFCRRLDIAAIIDRAAPVRSVARATHGQVIEALIANRLTAPTPMVHLQSWAQRFAVEHTLGRLPSEVLGPVERLVHPDDLPAADSDFLLTIVNSIEDPLRICQEISVTAFSAGLA